MMMKSDSVFITRPSLPRMDEYVRELNDIWESRWLTNMGPKYDEFQMILKE